MIIRLPYGSAKLEAELPDRVQPVILEPSSVEIPRGDPGEIVAEALENPIGTARLKDLVKPGVKVAVLTSDVTRPCPSNILLPFVLRELKAGGVPPSDVTVFFATGSHRSHTEDEKRRLLGEEVYGMVKAVDHDAQDRQNLHSVGVTFRGTEVSINREVFSRDLIVAVANLDIHYFMGYSGGAKPLVPGVASLDTIQQNHTLLLDPESKPGKADGNPIREDIEEAAGKVGLDFILNAVLNESKQVVAAVAGDFIKAHRAGLPTVDKLYKVPLEAPCDIVIASASGFPKDINLYQAHKALAHAGHAVKSGGTIILVAECRDGLGSKVFEQWLMEASSPRDVMERLKAGFALGGHKAALIAKLKERADIMLVSQ
ncbi:MAG: nickel-dependent lactate racemase, partial [Candidatus Bathyarchaeia archaeon]